MSDEMPPVYQLLSAFWKCLSDDLSGRGCTVNEVPYADRRKTYAERASIEKGILQRRAQDFLSTPEFDIWSRATGIEPEVMRRHFEHRS